ncbi:MAG TPA: spore cortex-lytic enzyme, partial [Firmicutes bacterium]|nr:spore cortex-lytic enzyme [Bacillota bacterium]
TVQQKLNDLGFDSGEPDGTMNDRTKTAIMGFQRSKGLEPHGRLDQQTLEALGVVSGKAQSSQDQSTEKQ